MRAEILAIGSELLTPRRADTNSSYLVEKLAAIGVPVVFRATVGDEEELIAEAARQALARADLVIATGGLGPTADDLTREGFARALGLELALDESILSGIRRRFERRGLPMPEVNRKQAMVPRGAEVLPNRVGTAPGLWIPVRAGEPRPAGPGKSRQPERAAARKPPPAPPEKERLVVLLPGPPAELHAIFESEVLPRIAQRAQGTFYRVKLLSVTGLPESSVEQKVGEIYQSVSNPATTILASAGQVELHLTARGRTPEEADEANEALAARLRERLGEHVFSESGENLEQVVGRLLMEQRLTLAVAESCTGGLLSHRLTEVPGSSAYLERALVTYSNRSKVEELGVDESLLSAHGAVSPEVAEAMARGARERAGTDLALAITGIAGPSGGSAEKPVGLVHIALCHSGGAMGRRLQIPGGRSQVKWWSTQEALDLLRLTLLERRRSRP